MFNARFKLRKRILLSDRCEPSMLTEVSRNTHRNIPHATFAVVHDRIVISNAPDSCPLKNPLAPYILPGPVETGGQQGQLPPPPPPPNLGGAKGQKISKGNYSVFNSFKNGQKTFALGSKSGCT